MTKNNYFLLRDTPTLSSPPPLPPSHNRHRKRHDAYIGIREVYIYAILYITEEYD
jgi:hypothetical protein